MTNLSTFRQPWPDEHDQIRRLFAPPFAATPSVSWQVAVSGGRRERLLGVAATAQQPEREGEKTGTEAVLFWRALPAHVGTELEKQLIVHTVQAAREQGVARLASLRAMQVDDPAHRLLTGLGFTVKAQIAEFEAPFAAVWERCQRIHALLDRRKAIPVEAEILPFEERLLPQLRTLFHNTHIVSCAEFDAKLSLLICS